MDLQKEREAFEQALVNQKNVSINNLHVCTIFDAEKNKYSPSDVCDPKEDFIVDWINSSWSIWQAAKAQAVPEGFVLVKADNVDSFYQDDNEPENFCRSCDDLDALGDCIDRDEIMIVNKHTSAHISTEKFYGAWVVIETSYGTAWKFKLFNTEDEAKAVMIEAQEQKG